MRRRLAGTVAAVALLTSATRAQGPADRTAFEAETLKHFQALLQQDTSSPPGNEIRAVEYLKQVLDTEKIPYQVFAKDPQRPNVVVRIKGNGKKKPILVLGHTDVVTVDPKKWTFPPFAGTVDGGYVYGRGTVDDKDNLVAGLMLVLQLTRDRTPLDRDVTLFGSGSADLWLSSTATDADVQVTVTEVRPDGQEQYIQRGWLRASQRAVDPRYSTVLRPFHPQTAASVSPLTPGEPVLARVEIQKFSHAFRRGSRIRVWIDTPSTTGEEGFVTLQTPATNSIWTDPAHPTQIVLGKLEAAPGPAPISACNTLIHEPCRADPVPAAAG